MTRYRKITTICCAAVFALGLAACGGGGNDGLNTSQEQELQDERDAAEAQVAELQEQIAALAEALGVEPEDVGDGVDDLRAEVDRLQGLVDDAETAKAAAEAATKAAEAAQMAATAAKLLQGSAPPPLRRQETDSGVLRIAAPTTPTSH